MGKPNEKFGTALSIQLQKALKKEEQVDVKIKYNTTEGCTGLQWLTPQQTIGKHHPYLFSQFQAIHARSVVPCQDSPCMKLTYSAIIRTPKPLRALMSALPTGESPVEGDDSVMEYSFEQKTLMPCYLIALAVGNLQGKEIGPRSTVWSEPEVVEAAAWEFADVEKFIATGEKLLTPYEWGRYDILVLPGIVLAMFQIIAIS